MRVPSGRALLRYLSFLHVSSTALSGGLGPNLIRAFFRARPTQAGGSGIGVADGAWCTRLLPISLNFGYNGRLSRNMPDGKVSYRLFSCNVRAVCIGSAVTQTGVGRQAGRASARPVR